MSSACASVAVIATAAPSKTVFIARFPTSPATERRPPPDVILMRLGKGAPLGRDIERSVTIVITPILSGPHHCHARICLSGRIDLADGPACPWPQDNW